MASDIAASADETLALPELRAGHPATRQEWVLDASEHGFARWVGGRLSTWHPVTAFLVVMFIGYAALVAMSVALGLLITRVILSSSDVSRADERFVDWLVSQRSEATVDASWVGSTLAGGHVIPAVIGVVLVACLLLRRWRVAAFVLFATSVESATYRATTAVVPRERPDVYRLESLPVDASYPSGHTAASIALFCGLALLVTSRVKNTYFRIGVWTIAIAIVPFVALSRVIRGMHHPLDLVGGVAIGIGAIAVLLLATRAAGVVAERRDLAKVA